MSQYVTRFLLRKDLLFSRLVHFDDKHESYCAWKYSFLCVVNYCTNNGLRTNGPFDQIPWTGVEELCSKN